MGNEKKLEILYDHFMDMQQEVHLKNQKKIKVGLKINILLPLVFLIISFLSNRSKLVFLVLWIVSLFGIAFYLLYIEYTDFKLQEQMKEFGIMEEEAEVQALIGDEVLQSIDDLNTVRTEVEKNISNKKSEVEENISNKKIEMEKNISEFKNEIKTMGDKLKK
ncbi:MAG: hypothetical protein K6E79_04760 [Pseudobutyrivibrio sp.]|nr:hypothetical protein [Pseudobutyrivibrio sp.]